LCTLPTPALPGSGSRGRRRLSRPLSRALPAPPVPSLPSDRHAEFSFSETCSSSPRRSQTPLRPFPEYFDGIVTLWTSTLGAEYNVMKGSGFAVSPANMDPEELPRSVNRASPLSKARIVNSRRNDPDPAVVVLDFTFLF